jgi:hypothetical protein
MPSLSAPESHKSEDSHAPWVLEVPGPSRLRLGERLSRVVRRGANLGI